MRRLGAIGACAVLALGWVAGVGAASASAHALLDSSSPGANASLGSPPKQVSLTFTEPPDPSLSSIQLIGSNGAKVALGASRTSGRTIVVPITGSLGDGTYTVNWRVVSKTDGHLTAGSFAFGVGVAPVAPTGGSGPSAGASPFPSAGSVIAKWLLYAGLALVVAACVVAAGVLRRPRPVPAVVVAGAVASLAGAVGLVAREAASIDVGVGTFLRSAAGAPYGWLVAATLASALLAVAWASGAPRWALWAAGAAAVAAVAVRSIGGHADAGPLPALEVLAQFAHVAAVCVWIGGLAWLLLLFGSSPAVERPDHVRRFSTTAGIALAVVAATGAVRAVDELGGPTHLGRLFSTDYGWTLVAKVGLAGVLVAGGAWNRYVNVPRTANGGKGPLTLRRVVAGELVLGGALFALTGVLTGLPPAVSVAAPASARPASLTVTGADFATTVRTTLRIAPGTVGANRFDLRVADYDTGRPVDARRVTLRFTAVSTPTLASSMLTMRRAAPGEWSASGAALAIDDRWRIVATIQTDVGSTQVSMEVSPRVPMGRTTTSTAPGQPTLATTTFPGGDSIQAYVDPGASGPNQLHVTAFDPQGNELALHHISLIAIPSTGPSVPLQPEPFSPGHFAANVQLEPGEWTFEIRALTHAAVSLDARFSQRIGGAG
jgi:copper transport protein